MAINISIRYSGGLLPDIILLTQGWEPVSIPCRDSFFIVYKTVYTITIMWDVVLHCLCFVFAFCLVSLHGD